MQTTLREFSRRPRRGSQARRSRRDLRSQGPVWSRRGANDHRCEGRGATPSPQSGLSPVANSDHLRFVFAQNALATPGVRPRVSRFRVSESLRRPQRPNSTHTPYSTPRRLIADPVPSLGEDLPRDRPTVSGHRLRVRHIVPSRCFGLDPCHNRLWTYAFGRLYHILRLHDLGTPTGRGRDGRHVCDNDDRNDSTPLGAVSSHPLILADQTRNSASTHLSCRPAMHYRPTYH